MNTTEYQRRWRARHEARTGQPGRPATQPCGTRAAYDRHFRKRERPSKACRAANAAHQRAKPAHWAAAEHPTR